jgi:hypothetical protein
MEANLIHPEGKIQHCPCVVAAPLARRHSTAPGGETRNKPSTVNQSPKTPLFVRTLSKGTKTRPSGAIEDRSRTSLVPSPRRRTEFVIAYLTLTLTGIVRAAMGIGMSVTLTERTVVQGVVSKAICLFTHIPRKGMADIGVADLQSIGSAE